MNLKIENSVAIKTVNKTPSETGISLITKDSKNKFDLTTARAVAEIKIILEYI